MKIESLRPHPRHIRRLFRWLHLIYRHALLAVIRGTSFLCDWGNPRLC